MVLEQHLNLEKRAIKYKFAGCTTVANKCTKFYLIQSASADRRRAFAYQRVLEIARWPITNTVITPENTLEHIIET